MMGQIKHKLAQLKDVITLKLFFSYICLSVCACMEAFMHTASKNCSPFTMRVPGIQLGFPGLGASTFARWVILRPDVIKTV